MQIDPRIFRAYDIRGVAHEQLTEDACRLIGRAFGSEVRERTGKDSPAICVGRDARTHGPAFERAVMQGLTESGCTAILIGQTPSPVNYFTVCMAELDGGIQVTASHNPAHDNGLKLCTAEADAFSGNDLQELRKRILEERFLSGEGEIEEIDTLMGYATFLREMFAGAASGMKVVVDGGNGVAGPLYCEVLRSVGADVIELYTTPDGTFPNHPADPSKWDTLKDLQSTVIEHNADIGLAFDGDGDRVGIVDEAGAIRTADEILLLLAKDHLSRFPGAPVVFTVSNSGILQSEIQAWGGKPVLCKVGHSFVEHAMREHGALLGGEQSGHFFCGEDYFTFDDALVAALRVLKVLKELRLEQAPEGGSALSPGPSPEGRGGSLSQLFAEFPKVYQSPERRPTVADEHKTRIVEEITLHFSKEHDVETLDGARIDFGDGAWVGIRQSNTAPKLSICIEARTPERLKELETVILGHMEKYPEIEWKDK